MLVMIKRKNKIKDWRYFSDKSIRYYLYILTNKIRFCKVEVHYEDV